jgi:hypothetical protein
MKLLSLLFQNCGNPIKGKLALVPKNKAGQPLTSRVEALDDSGANTLYLLPPPGTVDKGSVATGAGQDAVREIKEWQAIMDHLRSLPVKSKGELPTIPVDARAAEVRAIRVGSALDPWRRSWARSSRACSRSRSTSARMLRISTTSLRPKNACASPWRCRSQLQGDSPYRAAGHWCSRNPKRARRRARPTRDAFLFPGTAWEYSTGGACWQCGPRQSLRPRTTKKVTKNL